MPAASFGGKSAAYARRLGLTLLPVLAVVSGLAAAQTWLIPPLKLMPLLQLLPPERFRLYLPIY